MELPVDLRDRVLDRLGFSLPPAVDVNGLHALYRAWCGRVPFDNLRKTMALRRGDAGPLPGGHAEEFFTHWLKHGTGGTCWPSSNALFALLQSCGYDAHRLAGSMRDLGVVNHASVRVNVDGTGWLTDSSVLTQAPLPLGAETFANGDPVYPAEVERDNGSHVIWYHTPPNSSYLPCRLTVHDPDHAYYLAAYERSRERSPFNQRLYVRCNRPGELVVYLSHTRFSRTADGVRSRELSPDELKQALCDEIGFSSAAVEAWAASGAMAASFEPVTGPKPPAVTGKPPSMRKSGPDHLS